MPSKSEAQAKTMRAAAHNPAFAKKVGIPQKVGKEFMQADEAEAIGESKAEVRTPSLEAKEARRPGGGQFNLPRSKKKGG